MEVSAGRGRLGRRLGAVGPWLAAVCVRSAAGGRAAARGRLRWREGGREERRGGGRRAAPPGGPTPRRPGPAGWLAGSEGGS